MPVIISKLPIRLKNFPSTYKVLATRARCGRLIAKMIANILRKFFLKKLVIEYTQAKTILTAKLSSLFSRKK